MTAWDQKTADGAPKVSPFIYLIRLYLCEGVCSFEKSEEVHQGEKKTQTTGINRGSRFKSLRELTDEYLTSSYGDESRK